MTAELALALAMTMGGPRAGGAGAVVRAGCGEGDEQVGRIDAGAEVAIRFSMNGEQGVCYKVESGAVKGWVMAGDLVGLEAFDAGRRNANQTNYLESKPNHSNEIRQLTKTETRIEGRATETLKKALEMLDQHQPKQALRLLEWSLMNEGRGNAFALALAGLAAYQSDELKRAEQYWKESLAIEKNPPVERLLARIKSEAAADKGDNVTNGERFRLRFDGGEVPAHVAAAMLDALDSEYKRIDEAIGCGGNEAITAIVQSRESYKASSGGAEWSAAVYDGRIRVGMPDGAVVSPELRRRFGHEIVHACLARRGHFPSWFHEGLAQRLSGNRLSGTGKAEVLAAVKDGRLPALAALAGAWRGMNAGQARMAYNYALAAVDAIYEAEGEGRVREFIRSPESVRAAGERAWRALKE